MPSSSATVRCVVDGPSPSGPAAFCPLQSPAATGEVAAVVVDHARGAAPRTDLTAGTGAARRSTRDRRDTRRGRRTSTATPRGSDATPRPVGAEVGVALEDVQDLADRRAAAGRRAHAPHVEALVADPGRCALGRGVRGEVPLGHQTRAPGVVRVRADRRMLRGLGHRAWRSVRGRSRWRRSGRSSRTRAPCPGCGARCRRRAACRRGRGRSRPSRGCRRSTVDVALRLVEERLVDHEALARDLDPGPQRLVQRRAAVALQRVLPPGDGARAHRLTARYSELR